MEVRAAKVQWVILAHRVRADTSDPPVLQDHKGVLDSPASKANWETWASLGSREMPDPKENRDLLVPKEYSDLRVRRAREAPGETPGPKAQWDPSEREELLVTEDSLVLMDCLAPREL